jgi:hypothetical protein
MFILQNIDIYLIFNILQKEINLQEIDSSDYAILFSLNPKHIITHKREREREREISTFYHAYFAKHRYLFNFQYFTKEN